MGLEAIGIRLVAKNTTEFECPSWHLLPGSLLMAVLDFESLFQEEFQGIPLTATKGRLVMNHLHHLGFKCKFCRLNARILVSNLTIRLYNDLPLWVVSRCCNGLPLRMILRNHNCCYLTSRLEALSLLPVCANLIAKQPIERFMQREMNINPSRSNNV